MGENYKTQTRKEPQALWEGIMTIAFGPDNCTCCGNSNAFINTEHGILCNTCFGDMYFDGLDERKVPLSLDETRKLAIENKTTYDLINGFVDRALKI